MPETLRPTDVPRPAPLQVAALADGRLLLRGPGGLSLLGGVAAEDLERVRAEIDGQRTAGEIAEALAGEYDATEVFELLRTLAGRGILATAPPEPASTAAGDSTPAASTSARALVVGAGATARRIAELLEAPRLDAIDPASAGEDLARRELLIVALDDTTYATLFELQRACLRAGLLSLFVTRDADGTRLGPSVVPGAGPCLGCAQIAGFRVLGLAGRDVLDGVASMRTGTADPAAGERAAREAAREAAALLAGGERSALLTSMHLLAESGRDATYALMPAADCPLCGTDAHQNEDHPLAARVRRQLVASQRRAPRLAATANDPADCASVGIVGGGTAGYLTALALRRRLPHLEVTLIESSEVPVIGVGEATTPLMPQFLHVDLGLDVHELFRQVRPTLKLGIRFDWGAPGGTFNYPFGPVHVLEPAVYDGDVLGCSLTSRLMSAGRLPVYRDPGAGREDGRDRDGWHSGLDHSDLDLDVAYHLDNKRFVGYLGRQARRLGVAVVDARIAEVEVTEDRRSVTGLVAADGRRFAFDLYVDCSGFRSLLLEKGLGSPFLSYAGSLFTDRALAAAVPHGGVIQPATRAETLSAGWCWSTPQRDADHRGYVFCSAFETPEAAERTMRRANPGMGDPRLIRFRAGRHQHFWLGNVVAMGNAYGFVEPLESTALHMLIRQIGMLLRAFPVRRGEQGTAAVLNRKVGDLWDYLSWFLALHYRFNHRLDTPFWRHCRAETDVSRHAELIEVFRERGPLSYQPALRDGFDYPDPLWGAEGIDVLLLGQGVPARLPPPALGRADWHQRTRRERALVERALPQAEALAILDAEAGLLERWVEAFRRYGPAFGGRPRTTG